MMNLIKLDPLLKENKHLFQSPPPTLSIPYNLPKLPDPWLEQLEGLCREEYTNLTDNCFKRHIVGRYSNPNLIRDLEIIYRRLLGHLDISWGLLPQFESQAIIFKLTEEVDQCTPGFQNRVNDIVSSFRMPRTLSELLYQVRVELVKNIAATLTEEIHTWNRVTKIAAEHGLINANFEEDPYCGDVENKKILLTLQTEFGTTYTSLNLPFLLADQLSAILREMGYAGHKQDGYTTGIVEKITDRIKLYLSEEITQKVDWKDFFIIESDVDISEDKDFNIVIRDLNWQAIRRYFLRTLMEENYVAREFSGQTIHNLLDCAYFSDLFYEDNTLSGFEGEYITHKLFEEKTYLQLKRIKNDFPIFWKQLTFHPNLIPLFISELENLSFSNEGTTKKTQLLLTLDLCGLMNDNINFHILHDPLVRLIEKGMGNLEFLETVFRQPRLAKAILKFIDQHCEQFNPKALQQILLQTNKEGQNALMLAVSNHPETTEAILKFIDQHCEQFDPKTLQQILLQTNKEGQNALMLAVSNHPKTAEAILKFIDQHCEQFDPKTLQQMLLQTDKFGRNTLMLTVRYHSEATKAILEFIGQHCDQFNPKILQQMFLQTDIDNYSEAIKAIQEFISRAHDVPHNRRALRQIILQIHNKGWNALMFAVLYHHPEAAKAILEFMGQHCEQFDPKVLQQMILHKDNIGRDTLMLADSHPEILVAIRNCIAQPTVLLSQKTLAQVFSLWKDTDLGVSLAPILLEKYLADLSIRKEHNVTHITKFWGYNFGYSTRQKEVAALRLKTTLEKGVNSIQDLSRLEKHYPALKNGRLGLLFEASCKLAPERTRSAFSRRTLLVR